MTLKQKKLLILAGAGVHCKVVEAAREMGIYTVVTDYLENSPAKLIADESLMYDIYAEDLLVDYCRQNGIDGVLGFCIDPAQKPAQRIAERLGLPTFGTAEQTLALTDKNVFKALCRRCGVDTIPEFTEDEVLSGKAQLPVIVKPVDCRGSRGVAVCRTVGEAKEAISFAKTLSGDGGVIIERYMEMCHQEVTVTYIVKDGTPYLISFGDRFRGLEKDNLNRQSNGTIQPSRYTNMYLEKVNDKVIGMIKTLGINNGPVFMQGFVDGDTVRMYDPGIRFPGNEYERIYRAATGIDPMKSIISYITGGDIDDYGGRLEGSFDLQGRCALQYNINVGPGVIGTFEGLLEVSRHPSVIDVQQRRFVGETVLQTGDVLHRAGEISVLVDRRLDDIKDMLRFIQSTVRVLDINGKDMLISPVTTEMIDELYGGSGYEG